MSSKINKSWERLRSEIHSPAGTDELKRTVKWGLMKFYGGLAQSIWIHHIDSPRTEDMRLMSRDQVPEKFLFRHSQCVWFEHPGTGQILCLPAVLGGDINIFGYPNSWHPMPIGYDDTASPGRNPEVDAIRNLKLDATNSVLMQNDLFPGSTDYAFVEKMVDLLTDNILTLSQLQLLSSSPFVFNVTEDNLLAAKNFYLAIGEHRPAIFTNAAGEDLNPVVPSLVKIDPALLDLYGKWENVLLENLGIPGGMNNSKRANMTVGEVSAFTGEDKVSVKRKERLHQREAAYERINAMFGTDFSVESVIDSAADDAAAASTGRDLDDTPEVEQ